MSVTNQGSHAEIFVKVKGFLSGFKESNFTLSWPKTGNHHYNYERKII